MKGGRSNSWYTVSCLLISRHGYKYPPCVFWTSRAAESDEVKFGDNGFVISADTTARTWMCLHSCQFFFMHHVGFISRSHLAALSPPGSWTVPPLAASWNTAFHTFWPATRRPGGELQDVLYFYIHIYNAVISVT